MAFYRITNPSGEVQEHVSEDEVQDFANALVKAGITDPDAAGFILEPETENVEPVSSSSYAEPTQSSASAVENAEMPMATYAQTPSQKRQQFMSDVPFGNTIAKIFPYSTQEFMNTGKSSFNSGVDDIHSAAGRFLYPGDMGETAEETNYGNSVPGQALASVAKMVKSPTTFRYMPAFLMAGGNVAANMVAGGMAGYDEGGNLPSALIGAGSAFVGSSMPYWNKAASAVNSFFRRKTLENLTEQQRRAITNIALRGAGSKPLSNVETDRIFNAHRKEIEEFMRNADPKKIDDMISEYTRKWEDMASSEEGLARASGETLGRTQKLTARQMGRMVSDEEIALFGKVQEALDNLENISETAGVDEINAIRSQLEEYKRQLSAMQKLKSSAKKDLTSVENTEVTPDTKPSEGAYDPNTTGFATWVPPGEAPVATSSNPFPQYYDGLAVGARKKFDQSGKWVDEAQANVDDYYAKLIEAINERVNKINNAKGSVSSLKQSLADSKSQRQFNYVNGKDRYVENKYKNSPKVETDDVTAKFVNNLQHEMDLATTRMSAELKGPEGNYRRTSDGRLYEVNPEANSKRGMDVINRFVDRIQSRARALSQGQNGIKDPSVFNEDVIWEVNKLVESNDYEFIDAVLNSAYWLNDIEKQAIKREAMMLKGYKEMKKGYNVKVGERESEANGLVGPIIDKIPGVGVYRGLKRITNGEKSVLSPAVTKAYNDLQLMNAYRDTPYNYLAPTSNVHKSTPGFAVPVVLTEYSNRKNGK